MKAQIKYGNIQSARFGESFNAFVESARATDGATTMRLVRITGVIAKAAEHAEAGRMRIINDHAEKDEDGQPKIVGGNYVISDEGRRMIAELFDEEFECEAVAVSKIANLQDMTPATLVALVQAGVLIDDLSAQDEG